MQTIIWCKHVSGTSVPSSGATSWAPSARAAPPTSGTTTIGRWVLHYCCRCRSHMITCAGSLPGGLRQLPLAEPAGPGGHWILNQHTLTLAANKINPHYTAYYICLNDTDIPPFMLKILCCKKTHTTIRIKYHKKIFLVHYYFFTTPYSWKLFFFVSIH